MNPSAPNCIECSTKAPTTGWISQPPLGPHDDPFDEEVRDIYVRHALMWGLPFDEDLKATARRLFVTGYLAQFEPFRGETTCPIGMH